MKPFTKAALVADSLNLGPHWIYNQSKLARLYPNGVSSLTDPSSEYHPNRKAGQRQPSPMGQQRPLTLTKSLEPLV